MAASLFPISKDFSEYGCPASQSAVSRHETYFSISRLLFCQPCSPHSADPVHMTESSAHFVILWMMLRWRRSLTAMWFCHCGMLCRLTKSPACVWQEDFKDFLLHIAQLSMRKLPSLVVMPSAFQFTFLLPDPACCLIVQHHPLPKRGGAAQNLTPCWSGTTTLPTPFTCSALTVCAPCLCHPWIPKEGHSSSSLRLVQGWGCIGDLGLLRWPASGFHF